jgi:AhpD family alkylhydroperoxidase
MALLGSARPDLRLKQLAELKAAALVTCEFCLDIGSAVATATSITEQQLRDLPKFADSDAFTPEEKLVLEFAEAISRTPAEVPAELRDRLRTQFTPAQVTELAATVAWENNRGARRATSRVLPGRRVRAPRAVVGEPRLAPWAEKARSAGSGRRFRRPL